MTDAEEMANKISGQNILEIEGVKDIEYPTELNAFIIVTDSGKRYCTVVK